MTRQSELGFEAPPLLSGGGGAEIVLCGKRFLTDISGALYWPDQNTLVVADLHMEKGSAAAVKGRLLPPYDTRSTLCRLAQVMDRFDPDRVIALGDSFHDEAAGARLPRADRERLAFLQRGREWYWITGNHDPGLPDFVKGRVCPAVTLDGIKFRHEPHPGPASYEISGHLHPAARLSRRGASVRRKCFVSNGARMVVPAFGAYAGGLNVLNQAFAPLFHKGDFIVWMLGRERVYPVSRKQLLAD